MKKVLQDNALTLVAVVLVLGALGPVPFYAYYQLMNWVVLLAGAALALKAYQQKKLLAVALFALVAIVFNPIAPLYFTAQVWQIADIAAAAVLLSSVWLLRTKN